MTHAIGIIMGLVCMLCFGITDLLVKKATKKVDPITFGALRTFFSAIIILFVNIIFFEIRMPHKITWVYIVIFGIIGAYAYFMLFKGMKHGMISIVSPIANSSAIITVILSAIFLHEILDFKTYVVISFIIIGIILVSFKYKDIIHIDPGKSKRGVRYALATFFCWGFIFFLYRYINSDVGPVLTGFYTESMIFISFLPFFRAKKLKKVNKSGWGYILLTSILVAIAVTSFNIGMVHALLSIIAPVSSASAMIAVILGMVVLKEKISMNQKLGIIMIVINIIILSLL